MAEVVGIDVDQVRLLTFILGSALAAPAAVLVAADTGAHPEMGLTATLIAAVSVVVGGLGSLPGAFVGALIVGLAQNVGVWKVSSAWQQAIAFGLLLAFILFRPTGVFGRRLWRSHV
jgi:branched-chain amino acid transport system permease protein